jgi:hypothetical protein
MLKLYKAISKNAVSKHLEKWRLFSIYQAVTLEIYNKFIVSYYYEIKGLETMITCNE